VVDCFIGASPTVCLRDGVQLVWVWLQREHSGGLNDDALLLEQLINNTIPSSSYLEGKMVPLDDRQVAISVLLELTLQRATLSHILEAILLLLQLSDLTPSTPDKNRRAHKLEEEPTKGRCQGLEQEDRLTFYPLASYLRRLAAIPSPSPPSPRLNEAQDIQVSSFSSHFFSSLHNYFNLCLITKVLLSLVLVLGRSRRGIFQFYTYPLIYSSPKYCYPFSPILIL